VFYNGLGHTSESYDEPYMVTLIAGGLAYAVGRK
jgi:type 1 glutamine amidotransferase